MANHSAKSYHKRLKLSLLQTKIKCIIRFLTVQKGKMAEKRDV